MKQVYKTEEEFLKHYDAKAFDQLSMTADILLISVSSEEVNNYRKNSKKMMSILLVKRDDFPFHILRSETGRYFRYETPAIPPSHPAGR